jgi:arylsulfatase A-like enzyme
MYKAREPNGIATPPVYQTKYISNTAKEAMRNAGSKPFFLLVAPNAIHVNVLNWRRMDDYVSNTFTGTPVSFAHFQNDATTWRQHLVTVEYVGIVPTYKWWTRDSAFRDSGWGAWKFDGDEAAVVPGTGKGAILSWNVQLPDANTKRQQLLRKSASGYDFYTRDIVNGVVQKWTKTANQSVLAYSGTGPVVGWSAVTFPSGLIRQQVLRGSEVDGYTSRFRYQRPNSSSFTSWNVDPDWGETVVFGTLYDIDLIPTAEARYIIQLLMKRPGSNNYEWWQSPEVVDFEELAQANNSAAALGQPSALEISDEAELFQHSFMGFSKEKHTLQTTSTATTTAATAKTVEPEPPVTVQQTHPYYLMRAYAEGSWSPVLPSQTHDWGGNYPAGSLRKDRKANSFDALSAQYDLPTNKPSYNKQVNNRLPFYSPVAWPDLKGVVWGKKKQEDYLRRLFLDRLEQMLSIDKMVGEIVDAAGSNTVIIFTSDNGHFNGEHRLSNKLAPQEESIRIPLYIKAPQTPGRQEAKIAGNIDLAPTILDYAGKAWSRSTYQIDGQSLRPLIDNPDRAYWRNALLLEYHRPREIFGSYPGSDWRFGLPDYLGLRIAHDVGGLNANGLYVQYYLDVNNLDTPLAFEHYQMNSDPYQINNLATGKIPEFDRLIRDLYACSGAGCRALDYTPIPG